ncbi:hypothetical protein [Sodalinema gerasimenkoae]|uniref:hypothetical protein n=1 Tax=Sodalinema gerasimenkoae TaxID=2862348 RepID=UPI001358F1D9|nr:hypothetical protein [Sodalinema gerasimenkoae]
MKIYVKSRGVSQDYCWLDAEKGIEIDKPPELPKFKVDIDDFSLILQRQGNQLALLVTGLISSKRVDYQNRKIRNSVLWVADDESCMRGLVIQALGKEGEPLGGQLAAQLDEMISSITTEPGFQVDFPKIMETLAKQTISRLKTEPSTSEGKIGNLSTLKDKLRDELMESSFPKGDGLFLVVVSPTLSQNNLEQENIWRGLSDQIDPDDEWIEIEKKNTSLNRKRNNEPPNLQQMYQHLAEISRLLEELKTAQE